MKTTTLLKCKDCKYFEKETMTRSRVGTCSTKVKTENPDDINHTEQKRAYTLNTNKIKPSGAVKLHARRRKDG